MTVEEMQEIGGTPKEVLAAKLMDIWVETKGQKISWQNALKLSVIVGAMTQEQVNDLNKLYGE